MRPIVVTASSSGGSAISATLGRMTQAARDAAKWQCAVGYPVGKQAVAQPNPAYDNGESVITVAIRNNYGLGVPRRPFMDLAKRHMVDTYRRIMQELGPKVIDGTARIERVLDVAGLEAEEDIRTSIMDGEWLPNAPATVRRKGSDRPLVDTMSMHNLVTHHVRRA